MLRIILIATLCACQETTGKDTAIDEKKPLEIPTTECGNKHSWVPITEMGTLLSSERDPGLTFEKEMINTLLAANGLSDFGTATNGVETYRIRYLSQDRGEPIEATGFVFLPILEDSKSIPLMLYTHPLMGFSDQCAPTAIGLEGAQYRYS